MFLTGFGEWFKTILSNDKDKIFFFVLLGIAIIVAACIVADKYIGSYKRKKLNVNPEEKTNEENK